MFRRVQQRPVAKHESGAGWASRDGVEDPLQAAERIFAIPIAERRNRASELALNDHNVLFAACELLRSRFETAPSTVRDEAEFLFRYLDGVEGQTERSEERETLLSELAMIAGVASRATFHRRDAHKWFARAERGFRRAMNPSVNLARLRYQKLALAIEERRFEEVLEGVSGCATALRTLGLFDEALKCLFLKEEALRELGHTSRALSVSHVICREAERLKNFRLLAIGLSNLAQLNRISGNLKDALACARKALPLLEETKNRTSLAKLRWCIGDIFREQAKRAEALELYRSALRASEELGIRWDVAALHLVIAELLIEAGRDLEAEQEVRAALPIIDEEEMVPEGLAALGLLRESLRRRQLDREALSKVHRHIPRA